jgi:glycosyltransferase involved in cell wall biosynthesis
MKTRFSILVPVYNREMYIKETIDSVLSQTFTGYELVVIDDGSTDRTPEVLQSYGTRIKVLRQANQGPEVARNLAASVAEGEYLAFLDSDDLLLPGALATYNRIIEEFDSPALIIGFIHYFDTGKPMTSDPKQTGPVEALKYRDYLAKDTPIGLSCSSLVIHRQAFQQAGGMRRSTPATFHADEHNMVLRLGTYGPCVIIKRPATVAYRIHASNTVRDVKAMVRGTMSLISAERRGEYPGGRQRRFARYAVIGGMAWSWVKHSMEAHRPDLALELLVRSGPMLMAGALEKLQINLRGHQPSILLHE